MNFGVMVMRNNMTLLKTILMMLMTLMMLPEKTLQRIPIVTMRAEAPHRTKTINLILKTFLSFYQAMEQINKSFLLVICRHYLISGQDLLQAPQRKLLHQQQLLLP